MARALALFEADLHLSPGRNDLSTESEVTLSTAVAQKQNGPNNSPYRSQAEQNMQILTIKIHVLNSYMTGG